jgi:polyphosphate kinase
MPRNLDRRVEIAFPVLDPRLQGEILDVQLTDTVKGRRILASGSSVRTRAVEPALRSQDWLYEALAHRGGPLAATT